MSKVTGHFTNTTVAGESVRAFIPNPLPPHLSAKVAAELTDPMRAAVEALSTLNLAGELIPSIDWFIYAFLRKEALLSSEIEGTQATLVDVFSFEHTKQTGMSSVDDLEEVSNYVAAMNFALAELRAKRGLPVSIRLLNECHRRLLHGSRGAAKQPGEIRRSQNWIGGSRPGNAAFVPPPPEQVANLLSGLERYIHEEDPLAPLLRIAAIHVQFETVHPYLDGNGRVGRMLIALLLEHWQLLSNPLLYMSAYFKQHQADYYRHLERVRTEGDWVGWFKFFLAGAAAVARDAADRARRLHRQVTADRRKLLGSDGVTVSAIQLFEKLPNHPVVSVPLITRLLSTTKPTAGKAIQILQGVQILKEAGERKRDRLYSYEPYVDLLK
jgi:cell filamentation protein, protein adenylyltransferase